MSWTVWVSTWQPSAVLTTLTASSMTLPQTSAPTVIVPSISKPALNNEHSSLRHMPASSRPLGSPRGV